ncbi:Major facilitator superfamily domain general substrate transporter [Penicillium argentinense]|uniref:Major facilitator superfamily domain general substrate transporter n=1 Tax=Penicillium argentinense TaxID=1131581 RepID=A0A9W9EQU5_9EURO|nr:Major facilitator superfamily domain general substrate transporter [Penicillium argentinense]KAJ5086171.1 Major facilitator superfamily domain general substrate transporter [Penicillium argentinense]
MDLLVYWHLATNRQLVGGIVSAFFHAIITASFSITIPLHVRAVFEKDSLVTGIQLASIKGPNAIFSVPVRWANTRIGTRHLTSVGFVVLAPLLWMAGVPGDTRFPWAHEGRRGPVLYGLAISGTGLTSPLLNGVSMMAATGAAHEIEMEHPGLIESDDTYKKAVQGESARLDAGPVCRPDLVGAFHGARWLFHDGLRSQSAFHPCRNSSGESSANGRQLASVCSAHALHSETCHHPGPHGVLIRCRERAGVKNERCTASRYEKLSLRMFSVQTGPLAGAPPISLGAGAAFLDL